MKRMTKAEAMAKIEEAKANIAELESFVNAQESDAAARPLAERFTTASDRTGIVLSFPECPSDPSMPVTEFMIRAFIAQGGQVWDAESRIKAWREARFDVETPLWKSWKGSAEKTFKALGAQATVGELAGETLVFFLDTAQEVETHIGESFDDLMEAEVDVVNPLIWLGLFCSLPDPSDIASYPSRASWKWEWVGALIKTEYGTSALCGRSLSDGLNLGWDGPGNSNTVRRARSVVRPHAG